MTILDYIVIGIGFISVFLGITRGVIKEIISLAGWFIAFYVASRYAESFEPLLPRVIEDPSLRMLTLFVVVFFIVLLLVNHVLIILLCMSKYYFSKRYDRFLIYNIECSGIAILQKVNRRFTISKLTNLPPINQLTWG